MAAVQAAEHAGGGHFAGDVVADIFVLQLLGQLQGIYQGLVSHRQQAVGQSLFQQGDVQLQPLFQAFPGFLHKVHQMLEIPLQVGAQQVGFLPGHLLQFVFKLDRLLHFFFQSLQGRLLQIVQAGLHPLQHSVIGLEGFT